MIAKDDKLHTIADMWNLFNKKVINEKAPDIQRKEMKMAFYSGMCSFLNIQTKLTEQELGNERNTLILESWAREISVGCQEFVE